MNKISIEAKRDFLERLTNAKPIQAISELIWNGLDAGSDKVEVTLETNALDSIELIQVKDYGVGIDFNRVEELFGNLGDSWKKQVHRYSGRALHGKNGQGRFKAFALGSRVEWNTIYEESGKKMAYRIVGNSDALDDIRFSTPSETNDSLSGTEVRVTQIGKSFGSLLNENAVEELAKYFAAYLSQYPKIEIIYNGHTVDPSGLQEFQRDIQLGEIALRDGRAVSAAVSIIEWVVPTKRKVHLCDSSGVSLHETESGTKIRAPGFEFTAYIKSDHFRELDKENLLILDELHADVVAILRPAREAIRNHFRQRLAEKQGRIVERWKAEEIYPYEEKEHLDPVEEAERQVFDILAVNVESYLPSFEDSDSQSKRFTFRLLAQAVKDNPNSVEHIITEVLNLKKEEREELSDLLQHTPFSAIIRSAKTITNRLDFLVALENLLFDSETKKRLLERDQLHKVLENEAWIFDEEFALAGSEERLEEVLNLHLKLLGQREDQSNEGVVEKSVIGDTSPVLMEGGRQGRIDLMLSRANRPRQNERDHLVVELKRPSQKVNSQVLSQVEAYAMAVASDPRFRDAKTRWRFVVVSNDFDDFAERKANQRERPKGLVYDDSELNVTVWAKTWGEIIDDARTRLHFINEYLSYEANRDTSKAYLTKTHKKFIPYASAEADEDCEE